jgi:hypothetical protein
MALRRATALFSALTLAATIATPSLAQDKDQEQQQERRKLSGDERREYEALNTLVDAVALGKQPAPADAKLKFQHHFLRSGQNVYLPYTLEISAGKFTSFPVAMYVRAVKKPEAGAAASTAGSKENKPPEYPFADIYFLANDKFATSSTPDAIDVARALELPPGEYDVYIAMREKPSRDRKAPPPKTVVLVHSLSVPDLMKGLTTSSVILAKGLDASPAQLTGQQQLEQPYTISGYKVTPAYTSVIPKSGELLFVFFIYNEGVAASGKPDLDVDYNFFRAAEDKPFSKLATTSFNATTLPGEFNINVGHQVFVGQGIPLTSFTPGDYKLEIKVTDKTNNQVITRNVPFTVAP